MEKSYVDKLDARKPFDFILLRISPEFLIDQNIFYHSFHKQFYNILYHVFFIAVRQEVISIDDQVVVRELELAIKRDL